MSTNINTASNNNLGSESTNSQQVSFADNVNSTEEPTAELKPVVELTQIKPQSDEDEETCLLKLRAKLFRLDQTTKEWKERGLGDVQILKHKQSNKYRVLMRREHTLKICANHYITSNMFLAPNIGSDRSWVYKVSADLYEDEVNQETFAIRFAASDKANEFKEVFDEVKQHRSTTQAADINSSSDNKEGTPKNQKDNNEQHQNENKKE